MTDFERTILVRMEELHVRLVRIETKLGVWSKVVVALLGLSPIAVAIWTKWR